MNIIPNFEHRIAHRMKPFIKRLFTATEKNYSFIYDSLIDCENKI